MQKSIYTVEDEPDKIEYVSVRLSSLIENIRPNISCRKVGILHGNLLWQSKDIVRSGDEILECNYLNGFAKDRSTAKRARV